MNTPDSDPLPPPIPPAEPGPGECCRSGCDPCIFDLYEEELARYEVALREWQRSFHPDFVVR